LFKEWKGRKTAMSMATDSLDVEQSRRGLPPGNKRGGSRARSVPADSADHPGVRRRAIFGLTLFGADAAATVIALAAAGILLGTDVARAGFASLPLLLVSFWILGLYERSVLAPFERLRLRAFAVLAFGLGVLIIEGGPFSGYAWLAAGCESAIVFLLGFYGEIAVRSILVKRGIWGAAAAFVGDSPMAIQTYRLFVSMPHLGLRPLGFLSAEATSRRARVAADLPSIGALGDPAVFRANGIECIVATNRADFTRAAAAVKQAGYPVDVILAADKSGGGKRPVADGEKFIDLAAGADPNEGVNRQIKRVFDLAIAIPAAVFSLPFIGLAALAIKYIDGGPAFFIRPRIGRDGRPFDFLKLRTMVTDASEQLERRLAEDPAARAEWERFCKLSNDPRVLPYVGRFLRRTSFDELPQLWHVIRGEMSLVGPRPFPDYHFGRFDAEFQLLRSKVPQGVTGQWQVSSRSLGDIPTQKKEDLYYIRNWSIWLDLYLVLQTVPALLRGHRAC
jgi:lipopolysaccharide/colanic/teichoic acid biosynthesis glycosyltransferase